MLCAAGLFSGATGNQVADRCAGRCDTGKLSNISGNSQHEQCTSCPSNHVAGLEQTACALCEEGKVPDQSAALCNACVDGKYRDRTTETFACVACGPNTASSAPVDHNCSTCGAGEVPDASAANCATCAIGAYSSKPVGNASSTCIRCPSRGAQCAGGLLVLDDSAWYPLSTTKTIIESTNMYTCFNEEACLLNADKTRVECNVAKGYFGPLCGGCDRDNEQGHGSFTRSGGGCAKCWSAVESWFTFVGIGNGIVFVMGYLVAQHSFAAPIGQYGATIQKMAMSHLQMLGVLGIFKARGTKVFNEVMSRPAEVVGGSLTSMMPIKCAMNSQIYGPFLLNMAIPFILVALAAVLLIPKTIGEKLLRKCRAGRQAPRFKGKYNVPRRLAVCTLLRAPMTAGDVTEWHDTFHPTQRLAGVVTFVLFSLYPTLVASIASLYNCTTPIEGQEYLVADLTVKCYQGAHNAFLVFASIGAVVFAIGIPVGVAFVTAMKSPIVRGEEGKLTCICMRRSAIKYSEMDVRARFGFLFNGYATNRSGVVVAWEALVMLRKLAVTLAGSMIKDPVSCCV